MLMGHFMTYYHIDGGAFFQILICHNYVLTFGTTAVLHDSNKQEVAPWQHTACVPISHSMLTVYDM